jgi:hypothetical protein
MLGAGAGHMGLGFMLFSGMRTLVPHVPFVPHVLEQHIPSLDQCWFHIGSRPGPPGINSQHRPSNDPTRVGDMT